VFKAETSNPRKLNKKTQTCGGYDSPRAFAKKNVGRENPQTPCPTLTQGCRSSPYHNPCESGKDMERAMEWIDTWEDVRLSQFLVLKLYYSAVAIS